MATRGILLALAAAAALVAALYDDDDDGGETFVDNLTDKYPYWGWQGTSNEGRRCRTPDNTGCDAAWVNGRLVGS